MNFTNYIFEKSKQNQDKIAIFHQSSSIIYKDVFNLILKISYHLSHLPLAEKENIILIADNSLFFVVAYFGIIASGKVAVPLHPEFGKENVQYVYTNCSVQCTFVQQKYLKRLIEYGIKNDFVFVDQDVDNYKNIFKLNCPEGIIKPISDKNELAVIIFTSGSTGTPKGVMLSHYNLEFNTNSIVEYLGLLESDRCMVVLPFSYCFGTSLLHTHFRVGAQIVINNLFMFPGKVLTEINERKCTTFAGVPSTYQILLRKSPLKKMTFPSLRLVQQAGGKLTNAFITELREALPGTKIFVMYGQTEATARLSYLPPELLDTKLGSIGKGIPGTHIEVLNSENKPVKVGEIGEIVASGGNIMIGYWKDPEATKKTVRNGILYTGDLGTVDEDGFVYLTEREKDIIKSGGFRVSPKEIEDHISILPDVVEVGVIGIQDDILGEAPKAFISLVDKSKLTAEAIIKHCQAHFPIHKVPKYIEFIASLPKNNSFKVDKIALRKIEKEKQKID